MRKNSDVWIKWNVANAIYLHGYEVRIEKLVIINMKVNIKLIRFVFNDSHGQLQYFSHWQPSHLIRKFL